MLFICPLMVYSEDDHPRKVDLIESEPYFNPIVNINAEPSCIVNNCVNVITGAFVNAETDLVVAGATPIVIRREYSSYTRKEGTLGRGWNINHYGKIKYAKGDKVDKALLYENSTLPILLKATGSIFEYHYLRISDKALSKGVTNCSSGLISGTTNMRNSYYTYKAKRPSKSKHPSVGHYHSCNGDILEFNWYEEDGDHWQEGIETHRLAANRVAAGNILRYNYEMCTKLSSIQVYSDENSTSPLASVVFDYGKWIHDKNCPTLEISGHDGRFVRYKYSLPLIQRGKVTYRSMIDQVERSDGPNQYFVYNPRTSDIDEQISGINGENGRFLRIWYYEKGRNCVDGVGRFIWNKKHYAFGRVKALEEPVGVDAQPITTHQFIYHEDKKSKDHDRFGLTTVVDALGYHTDYQYNKDLRLNKVIRYLGYDLSTPYSYETLDWVGGSYINLYGRHFYDGEGNEIFSRSYQYGRGNNVIQESIQGNLTGNGTSEYTLKYDYKDTDLLRVAFDGAKRTEYAYVPKTNLLSCEFVYENNVLKLRKFYKYDANNILKREVIDDGTSLDENNLEGATQRIIREMKNSLNTFPTGLPLTEKQMCWDFEKQEEVLIKKIYYRYSIEGKLISKTIFGRDLKKFTEEFFQYGKFGNMVRSMDAMGNVTTYGYDANNNQNEERGPDPSTHKNYEYDFMNRRTAEVVRRAGQEPVVTRYYYDYVGNKIATIDPYGHKTEYEYDSFGRLLKTIHPEVSDLSGTLVHPVASTAYNHLSSPTENVDANGNIEQAAYTIRGKPYIKTHADGTQERFEYHPNGLLKQQTSSLGITTFYTYDGLGKLIAEAKCSPDGEVFSTRSWKYSAFHLLEEIDPEGISTHYTYYPNGMVRSITRESSRTEIEYDNFWRKYKTKRYFGPNEADCTIDVLEYDPLDRVIEERTEDFFGTVFRRRQFGYDRIGNKVQEIVWGEHGPLVTYTEYDSIARPVKVIEPNGEVTITQYDEHHRYQLNK